MNNGLFITIAITIATIIGSFGALFLKLGSSRLNIQFNFKGLMSIIMNYRLILGVFFYGLSSVFFLLALRVGELSVVYPFTSMSYIFVTILSVWLLKERINRWKLIGIAFIILGVVLVRI